MDTIENDDYSSQLRSLRLILGKNFRPISTASLAKLTAIPLVSIRAVEAGRRVLNDEDRDAIDLFLNARWDLESHRWVCAQNRHYEFSRIEYTTYSKHHMASRLAAIKEDEESISKAIDTLLSNLEDKDAVLALCKLHRKVYELAQLNNVPEKPLQSILNRFPVPQPKTARTAKLTLEIREALGDLEEEEQEQASADSPAPKRTKTKRRHGSAS